MRHDEPADRMIAPRRCYPIIGTENSLRWLADTTRIVAMVLALTASGTANAMGVVVSILPQKYFVERIAGSRADVLVMVGPGDSPATYEPRPRQISALSDAQVYFRIGVPFEKAWMTRIQSANRELAIIDTIENIDRREADLPAGEATASGGHRDPHTWTDPSLVQEMARHMRDAFIRMDPENDVEYERNFRDFSAELAAVDTELRGRLAPYAGRSFLVYHAAWGYFADAYGLRQIPIEAAGKGPGPRTLAYVVDKARALGITAVFVQPQFSRQDAKMIAREIGGQVISIDPLSEDYLQNLRRVATSLADAMAQR